MSQFSIIGTPLYQWEVGRKMKVVPLRGMSIDCVHFSNYGDTTALVVKPKEENGAFIVDIPNILLQDDQNIVVYSVNVSEDKTETIRECVFPVRKRAKPSNYIYTETEVFTFKALEERLKKLEEEGATAEQISEAVKRYLEQNPIKESDPSVHEWAKQPQKPKYSADEVGALSKGALQEGVNLALQQAKESGVFDGKPGNDYILTDDDKQEIADMIPVPEAPEATESSCTAFSVKTYGAIGDGITDDTEAIQTALDACHANGGGTVIIPAGTYLLSDAVKFYSNQHIIGEPGAVLLQKDSSFNNLMRNHYNGAGGYEATENVIIEGLTFDGGTQETMATSLLAFCHSKNITVRGCTFRNGCSGDHLVGDQNGHDIEINSSEDVLISACVFSDNRRVGWTSELIQIDVMSKNTGALAYPWASDDGKRSDDGTVSRNVTIDHCRFECVTRENMAENNVCIGAHTKDTSENILVSNCVFEDAAYAVMIHYVKDLVVMDNIMYNLGVGVYPVYSNEGIRCVGNVFEGCQAAYRKSHVTGIGNILNGEPVEKEESGIQVSGAEVGQILKVKEVDGNGVPTAWETAEMPTGGGSPEWVTLGDVTLEEDVVQVEFDTAAIEGNIGFLRMRYDLVGASAQENVGKLYVAFLTPGASVGYTLINNKDNTVPSANDSATWGYANCLIQSSNGNSTTVIQGAVGVQDTKSGSVSNISGYGKPNLFKAIRFKASTMFGAGSKFKVEYARILQGGDL